MDFSFAEVERALAHVHSIADDRRSAFANRLRHLQKLGFPPGINTGRGRAARYSVGSVYLLGVVLELNQLGLNPERAISVLQDDMEAVASGAALAVFSGRPKGEGFKSPMFYYLDPSGLDDLMKPGWNGDRAVASFFYSGLGQMIENLERWATQGFHRLAVINVSFLIHQLGGFIAINARDEFYAELEGWAREILDGDT